MNARITSRADDLLRRFDALCEQFRDVTDARRAGLSRSAASAIEQRLRRVRGGPA